MKTLGDDEISIIYNVLVVPNVYKYYANNYDTY